LNFSDSDIIKRYCYGGGIVRYLLAGMHVDIKVKIKDIVQHVDSSFINKVVKQNVESADISENFGTILVFDSEHPYTERKAYNFSSSFVASEIATKVQKERDFSLRAFLDGDIESLWQLSNIGTELFEGYAAGKVFLGGEFNVCASCISMLFVVYHLSLRSTGL
jgi:6-pyruvoyl-tetrahydropterin synthase